ncbi:RNA polymerase sigma factor SigZ [Rufibacter latericius]|uniref:RNA polymerase sigma factor SigZ n=1 Tax=Rufibacter latericius TaxID=2487040 RepID=A0A3M9MJQ5_9BACT|nr:RNA polymerase sigma factor SigZ [Rufibacter latericius]RNI25771.1 RNA polymerase sigma factor SigZ [Rufibacter latericius]
MCPETKSCASPTTTCGTNAMEDPCAAVVPMFLTYQEALQGFIRKRVLNQADAEDLSQQVLLKVHHHCETLPKVRNVRAWLYEITRHVVHDFYRARQREAYLSEDYDLPSPSLQTNPAQELADCVVPLLHLLPTEYAEPLRLSDLEGVPQQEIADRLGLTLSGAKSRVQRAREKLKAVFLECCHLELDRQGRLISAEIRPDCKALQHCAT